MKAKIPAKHLVFGAIMCLSKKADVSADLDARPVTASPQTVLVKGATAMTASDPIRTSPDVQANTARKPRIRRTKNGNIIPRQRANTLHDRVVYQLRVAALFIKENELEEYTLRYDGVICDGSCLAEELDCYADALESSIDAEAVRS